MHVDHNEKQLNRQHVCNRTRDEMKRRGTTGTQIPKSRGAGDNAERDNRQVGELSARG